jgi:hypothetical protein
VFFSIVALSVVIFLTCAGHGSHAARAGRSLHAVSISFFSGYVYLASMLDLLRLLIVLLFLLIVLLLLLV